MCLLNSPTASDKISTGKEEEKTHMNYASHNYYYSNQEWAEKRNAYRISVGKPGGK
jgi:hypothetical protein